mmetsp:Transcript_3967/g.6205  ORF Transcript_3967/g.6205 Transcript_3967/m.6205 type:complete len:260 (-) Transcript_3967:134-913(-)
MGAGGSSCNGNSLDLMMPLYYNPEPVVQEDIDKAKASWMMIVKDNTPAFEELKRSEDYLGESCICWFYRMFYDRLFDTHPLSRQLFGNSIHTQGKFLVMMVSTCLRQLNQPETVKKSLTKLAHVHCLKGVKSSEYGIVGDVLFWTLRRCLSPEVYDYELEAVWIKIYSAMLSVIVPYAFEFEKSTQNKYAADRTAESMRGTKTVDKSTMRMYEEVCNPRKGDTDAQWRMSSFSSDEDCDTDPPSRTMGGCVSESRTQDL